MRRSVITAAALLAGTAGAQPVSDHLQFQLLGIVPDMGRMSVNPITGEIAFGATGPGWAGAANPLRVLGADGSLRTFGGAVKDPDAVLWDVDGRFGQPGSILVGGIGGLFSVAETASTLVLPAGEDLVNPEALAFDAAGGLLFADYNASRVQRLDPAGAVSTVSTLDARALQVAVSPTGAIVAADEFGRASMLLSTEDGAALGSALSGVAFGAGGVFGTDAWAVDDTTGALVRFGADGPTPVAFGLVTPGQRSLAQIGFAPDGSMILGVPETGEVWSVVPGPASGALLAMGGLLAARRRR
ncbi:MAG: hypothetical protein ACTS22_08230 [Phycisphaerales bacterium]